MEAAAAVDQKRHTPRARPAAPAVEAKVPRVKKKKAEKSELWDV